jgi:hypothetical protein
MANLQNSGNYNNMPSKETEPETWYEYIRSKWNSDDEFDTLFPIFQSNRYTEAVQKAVTALQKRFPEIPDPALKEYAQAFRDHNKETMTETWGGYIDDRWSSDDAFDTLFPIFRNNRRTEAVQLAVNTMKKRFPEVPDPALKEYAQAFWERNKDIP